ncbi:MAG: transaldolase [Planctomycetes bacterium]|nr:transaldolase [Planctomycetota bacterium]
MEFFVDTADLDEIRESYSWGIVNGVTTNPSLIKKAVDKLNASGSGQSIASYIESILQTAGEDPVSLEVIGATEEDMVRQGLFLYERFNPVAGNVVVKIPVNPDMEGQGRGAFDGLKAIKQLADRGIPVNVTLVFTPEQALLAAKAGAAYVSPFAGRIDDDLRKTAGLKFGKTDYYAEEGEADRHDNGIVSGVDLVSRCVDILGMQGYDCCKVLAASLRNPRQVRECALVGAQVATIPFDVLSAMASHKKTVEGMKAFTADIVPEYARLFD